MNLWGGSGVLASQFTDVSLGCNQHEHAHAQIIIIIKKIAKFAW